ncbi:MAG: hypothetical protein IH991_05905 [Planctomycetes bacterium]|nr:hypothetical protein [Planctomycetota bacterium]
MSDHQCAARPQTKRHKQTNNSRSPSRCRLLFFSPFTPAWSLGLLLAICFFLPVFEGCRPIDFYKIDKSAPPSSPALFYANFATWPYVFGAMTVLGTFFIVMIRRPLGFRLLWFMLVLLIVFNVISTWTFVVPELGSGGPDGRTRNWLMVFTVLLVPTLAFSCIIIRNSIAAAMTLQLAMAALSFVWIVCYLCYGDVKMAYGGKLSTLACLGLTFWTVVEWKFARSTLWPRELRPVQFSLKQFLIGSLVTGVVFGLIGAYVMPK